MPWFFRNNYRNFLQLHDCNVAEFTLTKWLKKDYSELYFLRFS